MALPFENEYRHIGMVRLYRRHGAKCPSKDTEDCPTQKKKKCPIYRERWPNGKRERIGMETRIEADAIAKLQVWDDAGDPAIQKRKGRKTVEQAIIDFLAEKVNNKAAGETLRSFHKLLDRAEKSEALEAQYSPTLLMWANRNNLKFLSEFKQDHLTAFRQSWKRSLKTSNKQTERVNEFFLYALDHEWIPKKLHLKTVKLQDDEEEELVVPMRDEDFIKLMERSGGDDRLQIYLLVMRYTGLAPVDAIRLRPQNLRHNGHIITRREKTGKRVEIPLHQTLAERLRALVPYACGYWFWNRKKDASKHQTASGNMRRRLNDRGAFDGIHMYDDETGEAIRNADGSPKRGRLYQLRHTFVKERLDRGMTLDEVAELIGDTPDIVRKHYVKWSTERQQVLNEKMIGTLNDIDLKRFGM